MEIKHKYKFKNLSKQEVWDTIQDPEALQAALPNCEVFEEVGDEEYRAVMKINMGAIKGEFTANVQQVDKLEPHSYRLLVKAKGKPGEIGADSKMVLAEAEDGTELTCEADVSSTGLMATVGQRMIGGVAKVVLGQFFKNIEKETVKKTS
ncbi:CoxG family protein [Salinicoccus sp. Marseille-QA3877]